MDSLVTKDATTQSHSKTYILTKDPKFSNYENYVFLLVISIRRSSGLTTSAHCCGKVSQINFISPNHIDKESLRTHVFVANKMLNRVFPTICWECHLHAYFTTSFPNGRMDVQEKTLMQTPGSKTEQAVGAEIFCRSSRVGRYYNLGKYTTIYQIEMNLIEMKWWDEIEN